MVEQQLHASNPQFGRRAHAPYNFVELPEKILCVVSQDAIVNASSLESLNKLVDAHLPARNAAASEARHTGYFDVTLETLSPLYIRGSLTADQFKNNKQKRYADGGEIKEGEVNFRRLAKNIPEFFFVQNAANPVIPGSSLRGMLRTLVEVITFSKIQAVSKSPKMFYRAVADEGDDPRRATYKKWIGNNAANVFAGFLHRDSSDQWHIRPAKLPDTIGGRKSDQFIKVADTDLARLLPGYTSLNSKAYVPMFRPISFDAELQESQHGDRLSQTNKKTKKLIIKSIDFDTKRHPYRGWLACSGNMLETLDWSKTPHGIAESPRKKQYIVLDNESKENVPAMLAIAQEVTGDYVDSLTPYQKEIFGDHGILQQEHPVFYTLNADNLVDAIGHSPNFRIPARHWSENRAVTPVDFLPDVLRRPGDIDMAEAMFGFVRTDSDWKSLCVLSPVLQGIKQGHPLRAYSSRITVTDATFHRGRRTDTEVFTGAFTPKILASPKTSTFQHYLKQTTDNKPSIKTFSDSSDETQIRGHKMYWHKDNIPVTSLKETKSVDVTSTQHTRINAIQSGNLFTFRVCFEELTSVELGALCWVLKLPGEINKQYAHTLGMGKPLGMGAVSLYADLMLISYSARYASLIGDNKFVTGETPQACEGFIEKFEAYALNALGLPFKALAEVSRITNLMHMLAWPGIASKLEAEYMTIEPNQYKDRPVLPYPEHVAISPIASIRSRPSTKPADDFVPPQPREISDSDLTILRDKGDVRVGLTVQAKVIKMNKDRSYQCDLGLGDEFLGWLDPRDMVVRTRLEVGAVVVVRIKKITTNSDNVPSGANLSTRP